MSAIGQYRPMMSANRYIGQALVYFALFSFSGKTLVRGDFAWRLLDRNFEEHLCEMKSLRGFDVPLSACLGLCFHHSHTHEAEGKREWQSITGYKASCVVWKIFQKDAIENSSGK